MIYLILISILVIGLIVVSPFLFLYYIFGDNKIINKIGNKLFLK